MPPMSCDDCTCRRLLEDMAEKIDRLVDVVAGGLDGHEGLAHWVKAHQAEHDKRQVWVRGLSATAFSLVHPTLKTAAAATIGAASLYVAQFLAGGP